MCYFKILHKNTKIFIIIKDLKLLDTKPAVQTVAETEAMTAKS